MSASGQNASGSSGSSGVMSRAVDRVGPADRCPLFDPRDFDRFTYVKEDCRDCFTDAKNAEFDHVLHLAAMVGGREMIENNSLAVAEDLSIDASFWQWARHAGVGKVICFSSSAAYPVKYQRA